MPAHPAARKRNALVQPSGILSIVRKKNFPFGMVEFSLLMAFMENSQKESRGLLVIAAFKIVKGLGLLAVGLGALHFLHRDLATEIAHWVDFVRIDPHNHYLHWILERASKVDAKKLRELSVGTFFYSALFLCEGTGLALRKRWAAYMTIISTSSLMPIEILEIYKGATVAKVALLLVNVAVVAYLMRELRRKPAPEGNRVLRKERSRDSQRSISSPASASPAGPGPDKR